MCVDLNENSDDSTFLSISEVEPGGHGVRSRILIDGQYVHELVRALDAAIKRRLERLGLCRRPGNGARRPAPECDVLVFAEYAWEGVTRGRR